MFNLQMTQHFLELLQYGTILQLNTVILNRHISFNLLSIQSSNRKLTKVLANAMVRGFEAFLPALSLSNTEFTFSDALSAVKMTTREVSIDNSSEQDSGYNFDDLDFD
eukprot:TRINITY_DN31908_c0_g1_i18.p2 TRINITY_DN31908_c0_g1~~TRINITY_DN31908_c0_g1_i18.p2  ORF type:complete len:108 (-),score=35.64 TRINITY_DN31908_c0_g1_i18:117-440(-)